MQGVAVIVQHRCKAIAAPLHYELWQICFPLTWLVARCSHLAPRLNILLLESDLRHTGGSEAMAFAVAKGLSEKGHSIFLVFKEEGKLLFENRTAFREIEQADLQCFGWRRLFSSLKTALVLWKLTRQWKIEVVFTSHRGFLRTLALLRSVANVPFVYHLGLGPPHPTASGTWAIKTMSAGIAPSGATAKLWQDAGLPRERLQVVPNWIDCTRFRPGAGKLASRRSAGLDGCAPLIVFVGRIVPEKGVEALLRAFAQISTKQAGATLVLVGGIADDYASKIAAICGELALPDERVRMVGASREPELYLAAADIVVVPSLVEESFGLTAVEGMACGALTLVSSAGALPMVVGEENRDLVFPPGNVDALTKMLEDWISKPNEAFSRGLKLREYALKHFQAPDKIDRYEAIMSAVLK
jgi:glycosyltransferase involved in cell wall biosynthesis